MQKMHQVLEYCTGLGGHPGETNLHVETLNGKLNEVRQAIDRTIQAKTRFDDLTNRRKQAFDGVFSLAYQAILSLELSGATPEKLDDVRRLYKQLTNRSPRNRTPIPSEPAPAQGKLRRSVGQAAYVHKADVFTRIVEAVAAEPQYAASDAALSLEALQARAAQLDQLNDQVDEARAEWGSSTLARDKAMYAKPKGGIPVALRVKKYVRSAYGPGSAEYAKLKGIVFSKPK
jgi:hypothetical protein